MQNDALAEGVPSEGAATRERRRAEGNITVMLPPAGRGEGAVNESVAVLNEAPGVRSSDAMVKETWVMLPAWACGKEARKRTATHSAIIRRRRRIAEEPCRESVVNWLPEVFNLTTQQMSCKARRKVAKLDSKRQVVTRPIAWEVP